MYFPTHAHSEFSTLDGIGTVRQMVARVSDLGQPGLALTDHGNMAGVIRLYKECRKADLIPFPGEEFYVVHDVNDEDLRTQRYHLIIMALTQKGFEGLIALSSRSHQRERFYRKPLIDWSDLSALSAEYGNDVAVTTGCYFGLVQQAIAQSGTRAGALMTKRLARLFPNLFVEVQNHNIVHDDGMTDRHMVRRLFKIADTLGLPVVAGQDSHYCEPHHKLAHDMMKDICYFGDGEDNHFPGDSFHLASADWVSKHYRHDEWDRIEEGHQYLLDLHNLILPELDTYQFNVPQMSKTPDSELRRKVERAGSKTMLTLTDTYAARMDHELKVMKEMGFSDYFLLAADIFQWCRDNGIFIDTRGSANGSLVCYLLGITNVDPVHYGLSFDRFLSLDRQKPPDIDVDIESVSRDRVVEYTRKLFPSLVQIGTYGRIGIHEDPDTGEEKGSVLVQYMAAMSRKIPNFDGKVRKQDWEALNLLADLDARKSAGAHAGGFVIPGRSLPIEKYLATMLIASSETTVTQAVMEDVEDAGYLKMDYLGQKSLTTMRLCMEAIGKDPITDGMGWIPDDDPETCKVLRSGQTKGIFQYEGYSTLKGAKQMKVASTADAILCLALYRPAMMDSGMTDLYLKHRKRKKRHLIHPGVDHIMDDTWGVPVFQEQVLAIMKTVGLSAQDRNDMLKAVKASNDKIAEYAQATFDRIKPIFIRSAMRNLPNCTKRDGERIWATVMKFSDYGFNQAHATAYGLRAYRSAYLKTHHPTEYMAALLSTWAGTKKEKPYIQEARRMGLKIGRPDVNASGIHWRIDVNNGVLRKGLLTIPGVGEPTAQCIVAERDANGPFADMDDFIDRLPARPVSGGKSWKKDGTLNGVCLKLRNAGALKSLGVTDY